MIFDPVVQQRRSIRLHDHDYSSACVYFVTICTQGHQSLFGQIVFDKMCRNAAGQTVAKTWHQIPNRFPDTTLDTAIVMPDHFQGVVCIHTKDQGAASSAPTLGAIMRAFKSISAIAVNRQMGLSGTPPWQRNYYERIVRNDNEVKRLREYIITNPVRRAALPTTRPENNFHKSYKL